MKNLTDKEIYDSLRTWARIDEDALASNFEKVRGAVPDGVGVCAVVKADAYGHGADRVAGVIGEDAAAFAVAMTDEAIKLRLGGVKKPIIVLGHTPSAEYGELAEYGIATTVTSLEEAKLMDGFCRREGKTLDVHIAVDTGMTRIGVPADDGGVREAEGILALETVRVRGIFSHYATSDCRDKSAAERQRGLFDRFTGSLREKGVGLPALHICNSAAAVEMKDKYDMVRAGIILYGLRPSDEVDLSLIGGITPVMSLCSHVSRVRTVPAGCPVSYGGTFVTERESVIATVSAGYADGVPRLLSNRGSVTVRGSRAPIVGRVCMDQMMIDVTDIPGVVPGDEVLIFGGEGGEISADEVAEKAGTINYEIVCGITKRVPRVYVRGGKIVAVDNGLIAKKNYRAE